MKITLTVAVSTLDGGINSIKIKDTHLDNIELLIIHQISKGKEDDYKAAYELIKQRYTNVRLVTSYKLGLSLSRNLAIENCQTSHLIFSDDDNDYIDNLYDLIIPQLEKYDFPAMLSFKIKNEDMVDFKKYKNTEFKHNKRSILRLSSIEAVYEMSFIKKFNLFFDESFGLGAQYPSCEQPIFVNSILESKGNAFFIPKTIAFHPLENSGDNFYDPVQSITRRKMFSKVYGFSGIIFSWVFMLRKLRMVPRGKKLAFIKSLIL